MENIKIHTNTTTKYIEQSQNRKSYNEIVHIVNSLAKREEI